MLPVGVPRVAVEAGVTTGWRAYVGAADDPRGAVVGIDRFGESAPGPALFKFFDITAEAVAPRRAASSPRRAPWPLRPLPERGSNPDGNFAIDPKRVCHFQVAEFESHRLRAPEL